MTILSLLTVATLLGISATALIDAWNGLLKRLLGVASLDYCLLGRWIGHMPGGVFTHRNIAAATRTRRECVLGWTAHYSIGVGLSVVFVLGAPGWVARPTLLPALAYGIATVVLPFFVLQPALGLGVAASGTRRPAQARVKSLATHGIYGLGLYASAWVLTRVVPS